MWNVWQSVSSEFHCPRLVCKQTAATSHSSIQIGARSSSSSVAVLVIISRSPSSRWLFLCVVVVVVVGYVRCTRTAEIACENLASENRAIDARRSACLVRVCDIF